MASPATDATPSPDAPITWVRPSRGWRALDLRELWEYRELIYFLTWRDIKVRYKQTILGALWAILQPLFSMAIFSIFFGALAGVPSDGLPYPLFAFTALVPWTFFASGLTMSTNSMVSSSALIKKVYFPRLSIPIASVAGGLLDFVLAFVVLAGMIIGYQAVNTPLLRARDIKDPSALAAKLLTARDPVLLDPGQSAPSSVALAERPFYAYVRSQLSPETMALMASQADEEILREALAADFSRFIDGEQPAEELPAAVRKGLPEDFASHSAARRNRMILAAVFPEIRTGYTLSMTANVAWLPLLLLLALVTALGAGMWLAAMNVQFRDVRFAVPFLIQAWLFATPIAYPSSLLSGPWRAVYALNPMVGVVEGFRWALLGLPDPPDMIMLVSAVAAVVLLLSGAYYFRRMERTFADVA